MAVLVLDSLTKQTVNFPFVLEGSNSTTEALMLAKLEKKHFLIIITITAAEVSATTHTEDVTMSEVVVLMGPHSASWEIPLQSA